MNELLERQLRKLKNHFETENIIITGYTENTKLSPKEYKLIMTYLMNEKSDSEYEISNNVSLSLRNGGAHIHIY